MMGDIEEYAAELAAKRGNVNAISEAAAKRAERKDTVLSAMRRGSTITDAAKEAGVTYDGVWRWRQKDAEFAEAFLSAQKEGEGSRETHRAEMKEELPDKALAVLVNALDGKKVSRAAYTVAIFVAKSKLGMHETSRVEGQLTIADLVLAASRKDD